MEIISYVLSGELASRHMIQPPPSGAKPNLCPDELIDLTRGKRKSHSNSGAQKGARKPPSMAASEDPIVEQPMVPAA